MIATANTATFSRNSTTVISQNRSIIRRRSLEALLAGRQIKAYPQHDKKALSIEYHNLHCAVLEPQMDDQDEEHKADVPITIGAREIFHVIRHRNFRASSGGSAPASATTIKSSQAKTLTYEHLFWPQKPIVTVPNTVRSTLGPEVCNWEDWVMC